MALHLLGMPWTETTKEWEAEAYTARTRVLASSLQEYGDVYLYGGEMNEAKVTEHIPVVDRAWQSRHFPGFRPSDSFDRYDPNEKHWVEFNVRAADAIRERAKPNDFVGFTMGQSQRLVGALLEDLPLWYVEVGIGYEGVWAPYRVFESWSWRTFHAGFARGVTGDSLAGDVRNFDTVIPRPYDIEDFPAGNGSGGYFLYFGRVVNRKGAHIAAEVCRRLGAKLLVAGQFVTDARPGYIRGSDGTELTGDVEYVGVVGPEKRAELMGGAIALFSPTLYQEPFAGSHVEALLTGTPVIASDWGVYHETISNGVNGYTCNNLADLMKAAGQVEQLDRVTIRSAAIQRFGSETVGRQYHDYLGLLATQRRGGWYNLALEAQP